MRLYPRAGHVPAIDDGQFGHFEPADDGGFDLPGELAARLHAFHVDKRPLWEYDIERDQRMHGEETARRRDPETLYNAVADIAKVATLLGNLQLSQAQATAAPADTPAAATPKAAPAAKAAGK